MKGLPGEEQDRILKSLSVKSGLPLETGALSTTTCFPRGQNSGRQEALSEHGAIVTGYTAWVP